MHLWDANVAPLLLTAARVAVGRDVLSSVCEQISDAVGTGPAVVGGGDLVYSDGWVSPEMADMLRTLGVALGIPDPTGGFTPFNDLDDARRVIAGVVVSASRALATYRPSKNAGWLKKGDLQRTVSVRDVLEVAMREWSAHMRSLGPSAPVALAQRSLVGTVLVEPIADLLVTSPPYANGFDYANYWGPERAVAAAIGVDTQWSVDHQLGTNFVRGESWNAAKLPRATYRAVELMRECGGCSARQRYDTERYYVPRFVRYAAGISKAFTAAAGLTPSGRAPHRGGT